MTIAPPTRTEAIQPADDPDGHDARLGATTIAPKVVEKIARRATSEVEGLVAPPSKTRARIFAGPASPAVSAHIDGLMTWVEVRAGLRYPLPLASTGRSVQQAVRARVTELTGLVVAGVDVELASVFEPADGRGSVR